MEWHVTQAARLSELLGFINQLPFDICVFADTLLAVSPLLCAGAVLDVVEPQLLSSASTQDLAVLLHSLAAFGYRPGKSWVQLHAQAVRKKLPQLGVRRISNLLWAHAKLGMKPADDRLLGDMIQVLHGRMPEANTRDLANSLWALATLGHVPQRGFLAAFGAQVRLVARIQDTQEVCAAASPPHILLRAFA